MSRLVRPIRRAALRLRGRLSSRPSPIPKRLNFLWGFHADAPELSEEASRIIEQWRSMNPTWECLVRSPAETAALATAVGQPYEDYRHEVQRCDVGRVLLLQSEGGVYCDIDVVPLRTLDALLGPYPHAGVVLVVETWISLRFARRMAAIHPIRRGRRETLLRVAGHFLASVPDHPFWAEVLDLQRRRAHLEVREDYDVIYTTGPDVITEAALRTKCDDVVVISQRRADRHIRHLCAGSWRPQIESTTQGPTES